MVDLFHMRRQHPVGQGFCHSGLLGMSQQRPLSEIQPSDFGGEALLYFYDCGSIPKHQQDRDEAIKVAVAEHEGMMIDLLYISHFHYDHVSGLKKLLDPVDGLRVDTVVLPLVDAHERIVLFARSLHEADAEDLGAFYSRLVSDPVGAIVALCNPRQIILVGQSEDRPPDDEPLPPVEPEGPAISGRRPEGDFGFTWRVIGHMPSRSTTVDSTTIFEIDDDTEIEVIAQAAPIVPITWRFRPYVSSDIGGIDVVLNKLANLLKISRVDVDELIEDKDQLSELIVEYPTELRDAYKMASKNLNLTSLCLYSGPVQSADSDGRVYWQMRVGEANFVYWHGMPSDGARTAWLGTGDSEIKTRDSATKFINHFADIKDTVETLTLPHHGSDNNLGLSVLNKIAPSKCIAAAAWVRKSWKHPGHYVVQNVASRGIDLKIVTDDKRSAITDFFWYVS
jgi:hypothetical protein